MRTPTFLVAIAVLAAIVSTITNLSCNQTTLDRLDPPINYPPDPRCNQWNDEPCGHACCNKDRGTECNIFSQSCEAYIAPMPCNAPLGCGEAPGPVYMGQKHHEHTDAGAGTNPGDAGDAARD